MSHDGGLGVVSALDGITVLDLTQGMAGALAAMFLCDNGARVVRVDAPGEGAARCGPGYLVWDRGKESVALDIARDTPTFHRLVAQADVLVESFPPSSPYQELVSYSTLSAINPRLVHCSITGYGLQGPLKDEPAQDDLVMARMGILAGQPSFRPGPVHVIHPVPSVGAGLLAALGIVSALYAREKTGLGRKVETSLMAGALLYAGKVQGEKLTQRVYHTVPAGGGPFYSLFQCADGEWIHIGCIHGGFVDLAAAAMGIADIVADPKYGDGRMPRSEEARQELFDIVAGVIKTRPYQEWARIFEEADVPYARACTTEEALDNPQVRANEMVIELQDPEAGKVLQMGLPIQLSATPGRVRGPRPLPGQHTGQVLSALPPGPERRGSPAPQRQALDPPLKGVKVLEITNVIAGPTAGKLLADLGADVVKLESPDGDISRPTSPYYFVYLNCNKRSISVNTRTAEGQEVARRLAARADVLLDNMRPGATERMGIGAEALRALNPRLIEAHVTAYGWTGPYAHRPGVDPLAQALMGLQRAQGGPENPPVFLGRLAPTDYTAGTMCALGIAMALFARERTGVAQRVYTNLLNGGIVLSSDAFMRYEGKPPRRLADKGQYGLSTLHRLYETARGWIYLVAEEEQAWQSLCRVLGRPDLASHGRFASFRARQRHNEALAGELERAFRTRPAEEWARLLGQAGVPCAPVVEGYDQGFFTDPHALANGMVTEHQHPAFGRLTLSCGLLRFGGTAAVAGNPTPLLGEHTWSVLAEAGYSPERIRELYEKGIVKTEGPPRGQ